MPRVSVIIPNFNYAQYLDRRVRSVLEQTFDDLEVIYLDDASTDHSRQVISTFLDDGRIRTFHYSRNSGNPFIQWHRGLRQCTGQYVWIAEADDSADRRLLATLVDRLDRHPEVGLAYCQSWRVDEQGQVLGSNEEYTRGLNPHRWSRDYVCGGIEECREALIYMNTIPNASAVVFRRELCEQVGGPKVDFRVCGDWYLWANMALASGVAFTAEPLNYFRCHQRSVRSATVNDGLFVEEMAAMIADLFPKIDLAQASRDRLRRHFFNVWRSMVRDGRIPLRRQWRIYRTARHFDPSIGRRIMERRWRLAVEVRRRLADPLVRLAGIMARRAAGDDHNTPASSSGPPAVPHRRTPNPTCPECPGLPVDHTSFLPQSR